MKILEAAVPDAEAKLGVDHPTTLVCRGSLIVSYLDGGQRAKAIPIMKKNLEYAIRRLGDSHPDTIIFRGNLASALRDEGDFASARTMYETVIEQCGRVLGATHPTTVLYRSGWCDTLEMAKEWDKAIAEREAIVAVERERKKEDIRLSSSLSMLGRCRLFAGKTAEAEAPLREALAIQVRLEPEQWPVSQTRSLLGGVLAGQKKFDEALPLLRMGYEGLKQRESKIPAFRRGHVADALKRLIEACEKAGLAEEAEKWRKQPSP